MKAIIDKLHSGSIIEIPTKDQIIVIEVPNIGYCISVKYRNMMTWIELDALYQAVNIIDDCDTYQERLDELLGKTIHITKRMAEDFYPRSRDIEWLGSGSHSKYWLDFQYQYLALFGWYDKSFFVYELSSVNDRLNLWKTLNIV